MRQFEILAKGWGYTNIDLEIFFRSIWQDFGDNNNLTEGKEPYDDLLNESLVTTVKDILEEKLKKIATIVMIDFDANRTDRTLEILKYVEGPHNIPDKVLRLKRLLGNVL